MTDATDFNAYQLERLIQELGSPISLRPMHMVISPYARGFLQTLDKWRSADRRRIKRELRKFTEKFLREEQPPVEL